MRESDAAIVRALSSSHFALELKRLGVDALIITGRAAAMAYIFIRNDKVEIRSAEHLRGKSPVQSEAASRPELDLPAARVAAIGKAQRKWSGHWWARLARESVAPLVRAQAMRRVNAAFSPRNHRVEEALSAAVERADYARFATLLNILSRPFDEQSEFAAFAESAPEGQGCYRTFCGT